MFTGWHLWVECRVWLKTHLTTFLSLTNCFAAPCLLVPGMYCKLRHFVVSQAVPRLKCFYMNKSSRHAPTPWRLSQLADNKHGSAGRMVEASCTNIKSLVAGFTCVEAMWSRIFPGFDEMENGLVISWICIYIYILFTSVIWRFVFVPVILLIFVPSSIILKVNILIKVSFLT